MILKIIDNINETLRDDLKVTIKKNTRVAIAASYFSIYAFQELKDQLTEIDEFRFIFTSPTFLTEKTGKERREFYIPRLQRERSLYGTEYEIKLRNELTQKVIAKECAEWVRKKVTFRSNVTTENMGGFISIKNGVECFTYQPIRGFTTVDIGCEKGNNVYNFVTKLDAHHSELYIRIFDDIWNDET